MADKRNPMFNSSGCKDPTAYEVVSHVSREEAELNQRGHGLVNVLKYIVDCAGFDLISRIEIRDKKTRKDFR